jgi:ssDNA-binding Zn-finger/Zn-ribbon topoisomerase 1
MGRKKHTYEYVQTFIENEGFILLSKEYKNTYTKLKVMCQKGHIYEPTFDNFREGHRCPKCNKKGRKKLTYEYVQTFIENEGFILLSKKYKSVQSDIQIRCPKGHKYKTTFNKFHQGNRCYECSGKQKHTYEYVQTFIENERYILISKIYKNINTKLKVLCPKGHKYKTTFNNFHQGYRCPKCYALQTTSKAEKELVEYISTIYDGTIIENDRNTIVNPITGHYLELDIYLPNLNKAIEYNGIYWHSSKYSKIRDKIKLEQCKSLGITLLVVDEKDWITDKMKCFDTSKSFVLNENILDI